ncbi:hypothetical protein KJ359_008781 [Pestalotiopsis sp. 9143b]|nr:hypothetical protein KJ359_008781 [Pestalotiopsis sp. 9143b]
MNKTPPHGLWLVVVDWSRVATLDSHQQWIPLPHPAVKCVIGHYIEVFEDLSWACVIVGSFYDDKDKELWHTEVIVKRRARRTRSQSRQQRLTHNTPGK